MKYTGGYEYVFYNANLNFTLQYQLILAAIDPADKPEEVEKKIELVSCYINKWIAHRVFNYKTIDYSAIVYQVFLTCKKIRRKPTVELLQILKG